MSARDFSVLVFSICLAASGLFQGAAWGQSGASRPPAGLGSKPIGKVQNVTGSVTIEHTTGVVIQANVPSGGLQQAKADDPVYQGDVVKTGADGTVGIVFGDGTSFNVSTNARMEINEFVYDPKGSSNSTLFNLTKGTFTFLAGKTAKTGNMRVETPVGTMGIRGTAPHVEITDDGTVKFTTLVEEHKNAKAGPKAAPTTTPRERRAQDAEPPNATAGQKAKKDLNQNFQICRNC
jgi:hypothetical protein